MSASSLSAQIRAKKKLSSMKDDATDGLVTEGDEKGDALSENTPADSGGGTHASSVVETAPDPHVAGVDDEKEVRKAKIKTMLRKMGK